MRFLFGFRSVPCPGSPAGVSNSQRPKEELRHEVLIFLPDQPGRPFSDRVISAFRSLTQSQTNPTVSVYVEYAGGYTDESAQVAAAQARWFEAKYQKHHFDVVVTLGGPALELARSFRSGILKDAFVLWAIGYSDQRPAPISRSSELMILNGADASLMLARKLLPEARYVALYGGSTKNDTAAERRLMELLRTQAPELQVISLSGLPPSEAKDRAGKLPPNGFVQVAGSLADRNGRPTDVFEVMSNLAPNSMVPVFTYEDMTMGSGTIGGEVLSWTEVGRELGQMVFQYERGELADGTVRTVPRIVTLDWRQIHRFGIPESRIPAGARVLYRQPSLWQEHRTAVTLGAIALLLQALLIGSMLAERARRRSSQLQARESEAVASAMLTSVPGYVVMLDQSGRVLRANENIVAPQSEFEQVLAGAVPNSNYFDIWKVGDERLANVAVQVRQLTAGETQELALEEFRPGPSDGTWLEIRGKHLNAGRGGAVVTHVDITSRKLAEMQAAEDLDVLAHLDRVAALGELSVSLAHELNQPLSGIMSNAEAAEKLLLMDPPDVAEAREAVVDIADQNRRATAIIGRLRRLLRKEPTAFAPVCLNEAVRSVVGFISADAFLRRVKVELALADNLPLVLADMIQIQQVVLNLMTNAMQAMEDQVGTTRLLRLITRYDRDLKLVELQVQDHGPGIPKEVMDRLFEPFHTTKPTGLGMGLSICRSILDLVRGKIWADNNAAGGAVLFVTIPALGAGAGTVG